MGVLILTRYEAPGRRRTKLTGPGWIGWVDVLEVERGKVRLAFDLPADIIVAREETLPPKDTRSAPHDAG